MGEVGQARVEPTTIDPPLPSRRERLRQHLAEPFFRNAYSLVLNTGVTGVMGLAFWLLAARTYGDADVGRGSVTISVLTLLSGIIALNLTGTLTRFIGASGQRTGRLVLSAYLFTVLAVSLLALGFLLTLGLWGPSYAHLAGLDAGLLFVGAVVVVAITTLQDGILIGLRRSGWVPIINVVFGVAKVVLLLLYTTWNPRDGVYLSWVIPMIVLIIPVNALIFGVLIPRHRSSAPAGQVPPTRSQITRFFAADYLGAVCLFATVQFVPVMVATDVALHSFGYFYIAWTLGGVLNVVALNMAASLTAEAAYEASSVAANCRAAASRTLWLLLVAAVAIALAAPYGLGILGRGYVDATALLQLLALAALPTALTEIYLGVLRAQNATRRIAQVQAARAILVIGLVAVSLRLDSLLDELGVLQLTAIGVAVLLAQTAMAIWVLPRLLSVMRVDVQAHELALAQPAEPTAPTRTPDEHVALANWPAAHGTRVEALPTVRPKDEGIRSSSLILPTGLGLLTLAAVVVYAVPLRGVDLRQMTGLGLVSVLPAASLVGLTMLALTFLATLAMPQAHRLLLGGQVVVAVVCLHGLPLLLESMPRFPTAWVHMGFIELINRTGNTGPGLDARFSWPGFFGLFAFLIGGRDWQDFRWVVHLTPVVSNLLYLLPFALLIRNMCASWRARWLAAWLFALLNWVGQDYFSPQGLTYFFYLLLVAVLVTWFRPAVRHRPRRSLPALARLSAAFGARRPGELPPRPVGARERGALLALLVVLFAVTAASHQLTPFLMTSACLGLVVVGRCVLRGLPALMIVITASWISFMADSYWSGHLEELLEGIGAIAHNVSSSVAGRAVTTGPEHLLVLNTRIGLAVAVGLLAALGALRRWRKGFDDRILLVLMVTPGVALGLQNYGGEIALRVYLFALPAACLLIAYAVFPDFPGVRAARGSHLRVFVAAALCAPLFVGGFLVSRYGNEAFEYVREGEVAALDQVYENTRGPVHILWLTGRPTGLPPTPSMVHSYRDMERVTYGPGEAPLRPDAVTALVDDLRAEGPGTYILTTRSQEAELVVAEGYPPDWGDRFRARMATEPGVRVVVANDDAVVYEARAPDATVEPRKIPTAWVPMGVTPLTPAGAMCLVALLAVLITREFWSLWGLHGRPRKLRMLTLTALPLAAGLLVVVVERFAVLA